MRQKLLILLILISYNFYSIIDNPEKDILVILDVGQGDSIFFQSGDFQLLIDVGPDANTSLKIGKYIKLNDKQIDKLILTHNHNDHTKGLSDVLRRFEVTEVLIPNVCFDNQTDYYNKVIDDIEIMTIGKYRILVLGGTYNNKDLCKIGKDFNNTSLITVIENIEYKMAFVLMGDIEKDAEKDLMKIFSEYLHFNDDYYVLLKAGHHCSKTSTSQELLNYLHPDLIVCSVGNNNFGHPDQNLLNLFEAKNIKYYITKENGDLIIYLDNI